MTLSNANRRERPTRRAFCAGAALGAATASLGSALPRSASVGRDAVILVYLRGGLDGLSACVPMFEAGVLQAERPGLLVPMGSGSGAVDLDGSFALHPALSPLEGMYRDGELALLHAVGSADPTRSHFAARRAIDAGAVGDAVQAAHGGWAGRALQQVPQLTTRGPRGLALGSVLPRSLSGGPRVLPVHAPGSFSDYGDTSTSARRREALRVMNAGAAGALESTLLSDQIAQSGITALGALDVLGEVNFDRAAAPGASYPDTLLGTRLKDAATLVIAQAGLDVIHVEEGDWDDHDDMGPVDGDLAGRLDDLGRSLAALRQDLGQAIARTTVLVYSEFGRRVDENGSRGTDHGRGGLALAFGGNVNGGQVLGQWPGLAPGDLDDGAVRVTTDFRDLFAELLERRLQVQELGEVFPGHGVVPVGVFR